MKRRTYPIKRTGKSPYVKYGKTPYHYSGCIPTAQRPDCPPMGFWREIDGKRVFVWKSDRREAA